MGEVVYSKCAGLASLLEASIYYPYAVIYHDRPVQVSKAHERRIEREREREREGGLDDTDGDETTGWIFEIYRLRCGRCTR